MLAQLAMTVLLFTPTTAVGEEPEKSSDSWQIHGRVVDANGKPVEDFIAATYWSSNGKQWNEHGDRIKLNGQKDRDTLWKEEGVLEAFPRSRAKQLDHGEFIVTVEDRPRVSVFVTDNEQRHGGYVSVEKTDCDKPIKISLLPLVRVIGTIYCPQAERTPDWTMAMVHPPGDKENYLHFEQCGSLKGVFSLLLPPGGYDLDVYSSSPDARMPRPSERTKHNAPADMPSYIGGIRLEVPRDKPTVDLGVLNVVLPDGRGDYSSFYGKEPPALKITDARGISKDVKLTDLRGKWVLLDFWSLTCGPCLHRSLPELTEFYEKHTADRERFEILSICVTNEENIKTVAEFETTEKPFVGSEWHGKPLPFPTLIDGEGKTRAVYGIGSFPTMLLIDPEGHLVKWGDKVMLEDKLKEMP
ncbi:MAG TPA: TlpA disulfide reductase family protein [Pirellulales bacterium]|jgi:thiol-disulfide isomerase/thioredoxin|nr:TlpA disulfide reductase family protein [Pirellulales bacterium]